jgi:lysophospholipase L1-like esterase
MSYEHLVSLGSSMAAGPGIPPIVDKAAMRSGRNYPHLLADQLGATLTDLTISGATTETVLRTSQRGMRGNSFAPQIEGVPADADLATVTIGGNDLRYVVGFFAGVVTAPVAMLPLLGRTATILTRRATPAPDDLAIAKVTTGMVEIVEQIRERAPSARVVLVDYLTLVGPDARWSFELPLSRGQMTHLRRVGTALEGAFAAAADISGADLVKASDASSDHGIGSPEPWVVGLKPRAAAAPFHPNAAGMQAVADLIAGQLCSP